MSENQGVQVSDAPHCMLCGCNGKLLYADMRDRLFRAPGKWELIRCQNCQLIWLNPQPVPEDMGKLYAQYFTHQKPNAEKSALAGFRRRVKAGILMFSFGYEINDSSRAIGSVLSRIGPIRDLAGGDVLWLKSCEKGHLLDVGCGNGSFLNKMRQMGWEVKGVEPDGEAVLFARKNFGLEVFAGSLEEAMFPDGHFDIITMNHVIEHVLDPIGLLKQCRRVLRPGGKLIVVTPNIDSLGRHMFDDAWLHWDPPRHLFLFSPQTLRESAELAGLIIQDLRTTARGARAMWTASKLIRRFGMLPGGSLEMADLSLRLKAWAFQAAEYWRGDGGEELVLIATRQAKD